MIGIVADDVTGANDIGIMFAKHGYYVEVYNEFKHLDLNSIKTDVFIINTNSRCDKPQAAYKKVFEATRFLLQINCKLLIKKTCSVFRGNVGAEFDAMLDGAATKFAVVIAAFPKNGRITKNGKHFVHDLPLTESEFAHDPIHPMSSDDLKEIIHWQSKRPVYLLSYDVITEGTGSILAKTDAVRDKGGYLVCDVTSQEDLKILAKSFANERFIFGSSAVAEELPAFWEAPEVGFSTKAISLKKTGTLIIAGSLTLETRNQVNFAQAQGINTLKLDTKLLFNSMNKEHLVNKLVNWAISILNAKKPVLIYSANEPQDTEATYAAAREAGFSQSQANFIVSETLAEITSKIVDKIGIIQLIVAGGETSNTICNSLGIIGNQVLKEIQPGLPSALSRGKYELLMVLKSGSFGTSDFFMQAIEHFTHL
jgi:uncharacterized protein YgbK (DUF1537 family)